MIIVVILIGYIALFSDMLRNSRGNYTPAQIDRCSKMGGGFGKEIDRLFNKTVCNIESSYQQRKRSTSYKDDLVRFVDEYQKEALFDYCPPREHTGFEAYVDNSSAIKRPSDLAKRLNSLSDEHDYWRLRAERARPQI